MIYSTILVATAAALLLTSGMASQEEQPCNVCGKVGLQVGSPYAIVELPDSLLGTTTTTTTTVTCGELQYAGEKQIFSKEQCLKFPNLIASACNCQEDAPVVIIGDEETTVGCSVCNPGFRVGDPEFLVKYNTGQPDVPCGILQEAGDYNWIPEDRCSSFLPTQIKEICNCLDESDSSLLHDEIPPTPNTECKACPEPGYKIANPDVTVPVDGPVETALCGDLEKNMEGMYFTDTCNLLSFVVDTFCGGCIIDGGDSTAEHPADKPGGRYSNESLFERGYSLYIIIAAACFVVLLLGCMLYSKYLGEDGPVGPSNFTPSLAAAIANANTEAEEVAKFEEEGKLRHMVLDALFPEQKCDSGTVVCIGSGDDAETDEREGPSCSICLEKLDENESVILGSSCSHVYHRECILEWLNKPMKKQKQYHDDCPNCRQRMWEAETYQIVKDDIARREQQRTMSMLEEQM